MTVAAPPRPPRSPLPLADPDALFAEARRHRRVRRIRASALALLVLGAAGGAYWGIGGGSPQTASVPQIEAAVAHRRAESGRMVIHQTTVRTSPPGVRSELWTDLATGNRRSIDYARHGHLVASFGLSITKDERRPTVADITTTFVAYDSRSAMRITHKAPLAVATKNLERFGNPFAMTSLNFQLLGRDTVDGRDAYHLRADYPAPRHAPPAQVALQMPTRQDVWISTSDHRLVREQTGNGTTVFETTDFHWLPRTASTLAHLRLAIPSGFTHQFRSPVVPLPATSPIAPTRPLQVAHGSGVSVTAGANGVILFNTLNATSLVRKTLAGHRTTYTCFRTKPSGRLSAVVSGNRSGAFAPRVALELTTRAPFDGCTLSAGYGRRWPLRFGGHDAVEVAFTATGRRYFADRAAARELADFVRSRKIHELRRLAPAAVAALLRATYKHRVVKLPTGATPVAPGVIAYSIIRDGVIFSDRSTTGRTFSVQISRGRIANQNVKPLGYVF